MSSESEITAPTSTNPSCPDATEESPETFDIIATVQVPSSKPPLPLINVISPDGVSPAGKKKRYVYDLGASYGARGRARMAALDEAHARKDIPDVPTPPPDSRHQQISKDVDWVPDPLRTALPLTDGLNERFCEKCRRVLEGTEEAVQPTFKDHSEGTFMEHHNQVQLRTSAAKGCPMCNIVWHAHAVSLEARIKHLKEGQTQGSVVPMRYDFGRFLFEDGVHVVRFHPYLFHPPSDKNDHILEIIGLDRVNVSLHAIGEDVQEFGVGLNREIPDSEGTWSRNTLLQVGDWLDDCRANHPACAKRNTTSGDDDNDAKTSDFLPARLLKVFGDETEHVYLVEGDDIPTDIKYLTLSHCWGKRSIDKHAILTTANRPELLAGLHESLLPRTFFHACSVTRRLGFDYLWIDSLCIVQDSPEDWLEQSKLMWEIYSSSTLNISATAGANSDEGLFFSSRSPAVLDPGVVFIPDHHPQVKNSSSSSDSTNGNRRHIIYDTDEWSDQVDIALVNTRAWVLQERLLSRRIIHFSEWQVFWECHEKRASERFPLGIPPRYQVQEDRALLRKALDSSTSSENQDASQLLFLEAWEAIVRKYTKSGLTKKSDKLIALSALARQLAMKKELAGNEYLAGLWSKDLHKQLCWQVAEGSRGTSEYIHTEQCDAPSWSWASIEGKVIPNFDWFGYGAYGQVSKSRSMIRILEATVETPDGDGGGGDPFVGVRGGKLRIKAPLFRIDTSFRRIIAEMEEEEQKRRKRLAQAEKRGEEGEISSSDFTKAKEENLQNMIEMMRHKDPEYTGENLQRSIIQDPHGNNPPLKMAIDVSAGFVSTDDSSGPQKRAPLPPALTSKTTVHKLTIGDDIGEADMILDSAKSMLEMMGSDMYFLPVIAKSENNQRFQREGTELDCMEGLILVPAAEGAERDGDGEERGALFQRRGVVTLDEYQVTEFLCELGNQEEENEDDEEELGGGARRNNLLKKRVPSERLSLDDFMPEKWVGKEMDFVPRDFALYDLTII